MEKGCTIWGRIIEIEERIRKLEEDGHFSTADSGVKKKVLDDKELMLALCDCDRHEDVHLDGCRYLHFKEKYKQGD